MTTVRKNQFEELIQDIILQEVSGFDKEIIDTIEGLDTDKKRMAILSILDNDRDLFLKIKKLVINNNVTKVEHIKILVEQLRAYVTVGDFERKSAGEVQTPWSLVQDLINCYPQEVWTNPNLKWLDNSTGTGILVAGVVERLMEGLSEWEPDQEKRYAHIMENMIYVSELQARNCFIFLCSYDPKDEYELNIYHGSFLDDKFEEHAKAVWGVEKFNCILANPPYQTNNPGEKKTHPIWDKFVKKSFEVLVDGGYMVNVHPSGWRNIDGRFKDTQNLMRSKQILSLEIHNADDGVRTFGAATRYDFYCIENVSTYRQTKVVCEDGSIEMIDLGDMEFIPNGKFGDIKNLIAKQDDETVEILHSYSAYETRKEYMSKESTEEFEFPCVQNVNVKNQLSCVHYSNTKQNGHFGIAKVMFGRKSSGVFIDKTGKYGQAQDCSSIIDNVENLEGIQRALQNKRFLELSKQCDVGGSRDWYNRKIIATFRKDFWKEFLD